MPVPSETPESQGRAPHPSLQAGRDGPDLTKSRTEADSVVTPSFGTGTVYVSVASSPTTSMPSTKLRMSALRSGNRPILQEVPEVRNVLGLSPRCWEGQLSCCSSWRSASSLAASSCSSRCLREDSGRQGLQESDHWSQGPHRASQAASARPIARLRWRPACWPTLRPWRRSPRPPSSPSATMVSSCRIRSLIFSTTNACSLGAFR